MKWSEMADETKDGILFGLRLAANLKVTARREAFWASVRAFREATAHKSKDEMIVELKAHNPAYILDLLNADSEAGIRDRYVMTFHNATT